MPVAGWKVGIKSKPFLGGKQVGVMETERGASVSPLQEILLLDVVLVSFVATNIPENLGRTSVGTSYGLNGQRWWLWDQNTILRALF